MDPLSQLPLECLQHIFQVLDDNDDVASLAALLSINKYIASVALPYLYRDPFRHAFYYEKKEQAPPRKGVPAYRASRKVTRMLLDSLPSASLPTGLSVALAVSTTTTATTTITTPETETIAATIIDNEELIVHLSSSTPSSPFDYQTYIRHINLEPGFVEVAFPLLYERIFHDSILGYIATKTFDDIYQAQPLSTRYGRPGLNEPGVLYRYYISILHHEIIWCLAFPILEQLQSLTIQHTYSLNQFMNVVDRLRSLEEVRFSFMDVQGYIFQDPDWDTMISRGETAAWEMVRFVQEHARLFSGRLKTVHCFNDSHQWNDWSFVKDVKQEIYRTLPPLSKPTHLEKDNWLQIMAHPDSTDLGHVWMVDGGGMPAMWYDAICNNGQSILQRCRAMRVLKLELFLASQGPFQWAVQEKRDLEEFAATGRSFYSDHEATFQSAHRTHGLLQLEDITITGFDHDRTMAINDIVFAFSGTLKRLAIDSLERPPSILPEPLHLGQGWVSLPVLTHLTLKIDMNRLVIDPDLLTQCLNLTDVLISDWTLQYRCQDIIPCSSANITSLQSLKLRGWSALTFNPATLSSTTQLAVLELTLQQMDLNPSIYQGFLPPVMEICRSYGIQDCVSSSSSQTNEQAEDIDNGTTVRRILRPQWTWDWYLPRLTRLVLETEFAILFEFKMLVGCPALEFLRLEMRSTVRGSHTRTLAETDFLILPTVTHANDDLSSSSADAAMSATTYTTRPPPCERLCLPSLQSLDLFGAWVIDELVLRQLFQVTFPNLATFVLQEWHFNTFRSLFNLIKTGSILPKGDRKRRLTPSTITTLSSHDTNHVEDDEGNPKLIIAPSTPSRAALTRLGWKFVGGPNCSTKDEVAETVQYHKDIGVMFAHYVSDCTLRVWHGGIGLQCTKSDDE
ncbi:hypothetical protein BGX24_004679 [Mortierella sp. AD032]|nr:hypothetical protein BGX24_004679 [Mortierella sp. AD032]